MVVKQRAMAVEDKAERRNAILDAAEALFLEHPDRMASVSEVAIEAGVGKGTVYLYFPGKEEMLLALHERHVSSFFNALIALLDRPAVDFDAILAVTRKHIIRGAGYLPLTSRCFGLLDRDIPVQCGLEFKVRVGQLLAAAGTRLERHFPALRPGDGLALLCNSYGLMVGMWQLLNPNKRLGAAMERPELRMLNRDFEREVEAALRALWTGTLARNAATKPAKSRRKVK
jgi:AcrR family transcriptional regulator